MYDDGPKALVLSDADCRELAEAFLAGRQELGRQMAIARAEDGDLTEEASPEEQGDALKGDVVNCLRSGGYYLIGGNGISETTITLHWGPKFPGRDYDPYVPA